MKGLLEYKGYHGTVEYSAEDNILFGSVIGIRSLISYEGQSTDELKADFEGAVDEYLELCAEKGISPEKEYKGSLNIRISPEAHRKASLVAIAENISLNQFIERSIVEKLSTYSV